MATLIATCRQAGPVAIVDLSGRISLGEGSALLRKTVRDLLEAGQTRILLNLGDVNYIDSSGIGMLVACAGHMEQSNGRMRVVGASGTVLKAFSIVHMERITPLNDSIEEAAAAFE